MIKQMTGIEQTLFEVLQDGRLHKRADLLRVMDEDGLADRKLLSVRFCLMRKKLRPLGVDIVCCLHHRTIHYRLVREFLPTITDE